MVPCSEETAPAAEEKLNLRWVEASLEELWKSKSRSREFRDYILILYHTCPPASPHKLLLITAMSGSV